MNKFSMISIGNKQDTRRVALAIGNINLGQQAFELVMSGKLPKGDVLALANIAGISGAKNAPMIMPLCHPLPIDHVSINIEPINEDFSINIYCTASTFGKTGVEMEALAGVQAALINIWDLCKMINPNLLINNVRLLAKIGGKSGFWKNEEALTPLAKELIKDWE